MTGFPGDQATFKVPSLRNIGVRAPYMHDGRIDTLEDVIEHYSTGVEPHSRLPPFLQTLTDDEFLTDPKFSDPFIRE